MRAPVAFIGLSNSGKTTLLVSLVEHLAGSGERVAVIKHTHHDPKRRKPWGDSERFLEAGASQVVLAGHLEAIVLEQNAEPETRSFTSASEIPGWLDADRVLIEGFKSLDLCPRILVERASGEVVRPIPRVDAIVTDSRETFEFPSFTHDDLEALTVFLDRITSET